MALRGLWDSFFSRKGGAAMTDWSRFWPFKKVAFAAGAPVPPEEVTPEKLQQMVQVLRGEWK